MGIQDRDWYWQDRDRKEGGRRRRRASSWHEHPLVAPLIVLAGGALIWLVMVLVLQWRAETAMKEMLRTSGQSAVRARIQAEQIQRDAAQAQAVRLARQQRQEGLRSHAIAERGRIETQRVDDVAAEVVRKQRAWARFYRKPAICDDAATMECANACIRAKRNFEERYARGGL